jgi:hypothetical protein
MTSEPTRHLANETEGSIPPKWNRLQYAGPLEEISLHIGYSWDEQIEQLQVVWPTCQKPGGRVVDIQASSDLFDGLDLIRTHAEKAWDMELIACLIDLETALRFAPKMFVGAVEDLLVCAQASSVAHNAVGWSGAGDLGEAPHVQTR